MAGRTLTENLAILFPSTDWEYKVITRSGGSKLSVVAADYNNQFSDLGSSVYYYDLYSCFRGVNQSIQFCVEDGGKAYTRIDEDRVAKIADEILLVKNSTQKTFPSEKWYYYPPDKATGSEPTIRAFVKDAAEAEKIVLFTKNCKIMAQSFPHEGGNIVAISYEQIRDLLQSQEVTKKPQSMLIPHAEPQVESYNGVRYNRIASFKHDLDFLRRLDLAFSTNGFWLQIGNGKNYKEESTGWKLHFSCATSDIAEAFDIIMPYALANGFTIKVANPELATEFGKEGSQQQGKMIIIYDQEGFRASKSQNFNWHGFLKEIEIKLREAGVKTGPQVVLDDGGAPEPKIKGSNYIYFRNDGNTGDKPNATIDLRAKRGYRYAAHTPDHNPMKMRDFLAVVDLNAESATEWAIKAKQQPVGWGK